MVIAAVYLAVLVTMIFCESVQSRNGCSIEKESPCGGLLKFSKDKTEFQLTSPGFPHQSYAKGASCLWKFDSFDFHQIEVEINEMNLPEYEGSTECGEKDTLRFLTPRGFLVGTVCSGSVDAEPMIKPRYHVKFDAGLTSGNAIYGFNITLRAVPFHTLTCNLDGYELRLSLDRLNPPSVYPYENYHLMEKRCKAKQDGNELVLKSGYQTCGTSYDEHNGYSNAAYMNPAKEGGLVIQYPILCRITATDQIVSGRYTIHTGEQQLRFAAEDMGIRSAGSVDIGGPKTMEGSIPVNLRLDIYDNDEFHPDGQRDHLQPNMVYFEVSAQNASSVVLAVKKCWITGSADPRDLNVIIFMENGEATSGHHLLKMKSPLFAERFQISHSDTELPGGPSRQYIHCAVNVCPNISAKTNGDQMTQKHMCPSRRFDAK